ncbi:hypothetical protein KFK09_013030 [Dendrobium nobile]|uniref:Uncharacterized protein n=1 Tax=Dendrobium nobile TaxID=94219 RepID=A0A8T3BKJ4_DENNO|nr:hypothetical protein KFK09_013030 [Dendrobium nobile]
MFLLNFRLKRLKKNGEVSMFDIIVMFIIINIINKNIIIIIMVDFSKIVGD